MKKNDDDLPWAGDLIKGIVLLAAFFIYEFCMFYLLCDDSDIGDTCFAPFPLNFYYGFQYAVLFAIPWALVLYGGRALFVWLGFIKKS